MEKFLENIKLLVNALGFKIFEELRKDQTEEEQRKSTFYIVAARGAKAKGQMTNEGFVVLKNSEIATTLTNSFPVNMEKFRQSLIDDDIVTRVNNKLEIGRASCRERE